MKLQKLESENIEKLERLTKEQLIRTIIRHNRIFKTVFKHICSSFIMNAFFIGFICCILFALLIS